MNNSSFNISDNIQIIELHIAEIMNSNSIKKSPQLKNLLKYLVDSVILGKESQLKGYTIGVEALNRSADFDPQNDPIVRVQARRLREALHQFYQEEGRSSEIEISIEKGAYKPIFRKRAVPAVADAAAPLPQAKPSARGRPPTWSLGIGMLALIAGLGFVLIDKRTLRRSASAIEAGSALQAAREDGGIAERDASRKFDSYRFRPNIFLLAHKARPIPAADLQDAAEIVARYKLMRVGHAGPEASGVPDQQVPDSLLFDVEIGECENCAVPSLEVSVLTRPRRDIIYSMSFPIDPTNRHRTLTRMMQAVASMDGPIMVHLRRTRETIPRALSCLGDTYFYAQTFDRSVRDRMRACADDYRASKEEDPVMEQVVAFRFLDSYWFLDDPHNSLTQALVASKRAIELSPAFAHAHVLRSMVLATSGAAEQALKVAEHAYELNPNDELTTFNLAVRLLQLGQTAKARDLLEALHNDNSVPPIWITTHLGVIYLLMDDLKALSRLLPQLRGSSMPLANVLLVIAESRSADASFGQQALVQLKALYPMLTLKYASRVYLAAYFRNPDIAKVVIEAFETALAEIRNAPADARN